MYSASQEEVAVMQGVFTNSKGFSVSLWMNLSLSLKEEGGHEKHKSTDTVT